MAWLVVKRKMPSATATGYGSSIKREKLVALRFQTARVASPDSRVGFLFHPQRRANETGLELGLRGRLNS